MNHHTQSREVTFMPTFLPLLADKVSMKNTLKKRGVTNLQDIVLS